MSKDAATNNSIDTPPRALSKAFAILVALLSLAGIAVSAELTRIHLFVHTDPSYHSVCAMSEGVNCETVAVSPYSVFAGLPVSVWGIFGYLAMTVLAIWGVARGRMHDTWPFGLLLALSAFFAATSAALAFISVTSIDSLCLFCMGSYAVNVALLAVCVAARRRARVRAASMLLADVKALLSRPAITALFAALAVAAVAALELMVPAYWRTPGWTDLPSLAFGTDADGHHWIGARAPKLTITEFSDYECPHCRAAHKATRLLAAEHPRDIRLVHRHLPLDMECHPKLKEMRRPFHRRACLFARAAECAGAQDRFWDMNDALFSIQETVKTENVDPVELAVRLGLDRSEFKACLEGDEAKTRVAADLEEAMERELGGTPSFLVGDQLFVGRVPKARLEQMLAETSRVK